MRHAGQCLGDEALCHRDEGNLGAAAALLERRIAEAKAGKDFPIAASLFESLAALWVDVPDEGTKSTFVGRFRLALGCAPFHCGLRSAIGSVSSLRSMGAIHESGIESVASPFESDAAAIVVSEETGTISLGSEGKLVRGLKAETLRARLINALQPSNGREGALKRLRGRVRKK